MRSGEDDRNAVVFALRTPPAFQSFKRVGLNGGGEMRLTEELLARGQDDDADMRGFRLEDDLPEKDKTRVFLKLFLENQKRLYAYVLTLLPHRADADDVLQEVSFLLWDKFDPERPPEDFAAWGCRIAYFKVLEFFKKNRRCRVRFSQEMLERLSETIIDQSEVLQLDERREALTGCLGRLSSKDREFLTQRFANGATTESTAATVGRTVAAVYQALSRVRQTLLDCVNRSLGQGGYES
jgi:RNA polymerase sigma-70 factor (ECF subfamily)